MVSSSSFGGTDFQFLTVYMTRPLLLSLHVINSSSPSIEGCSTCIQVLYRHASQRSFKAMLSAAEQKYAMIQQ